jgi:hypothetical protein
MASAELLEGLLEGLNVDWADQLKDQRLVVARRAFGVGDHARDHLGLLERQWARCHAQAYG